MRKGTQKGQLKISLKELLAQHSEPKRNDWANGSLTQPAPGGDGFPEYDPKAFESASDEEVEARTGAGGSFAVLAALEDDSGWTTVGSTKRKATGAAAGPSAPQAAAPPSISSPAVARRPAAPAALPNRPPVLPTALVGPRSNSALGSAVPSTSAGASVLRAPYMLTNGNAPVARAQRPQTHNEEGRPISETYYQFFQKVYRNPSGAVCMRFHKTDIVTVRPNGNVVLTSGGYRTRTTFSSVSEALEPIGLLLDSSGGEGRGDWWVQQPDGTHVPWADGMEIPARGPEDRDRAERLLAAYAGTPQGGGAGGTSAAGGGVGAGYGASGNGSSSSSSAVSNGVPRPAAPPAPAPARPAPSAWSYRSAAGAAAPATTPSPVGVSAYAPQLRPTSATTTASSAAAATVIPAPAPSPAPRSAASAGELAAMLNQALALQDGAAGEGCEVLDDEHACIACMAALKTTILIPCGHMVLCANCAADVLARSGRCPMCRTEVANHVTVSM